MSLHVGPVNVKYLTDANSELSSLFTDGQGGLACCNSWGLEELDTTERLN